MNKVAEGVWEWPWYSTEKQIHFNGHFLIVDQTKVLVDPPPLVPEDKALIKEAGIDGIVITNRDHVREAAGYRSLFGTSLWMPEADAGLVEIAADRTFRGGESLFGAMEVVSIPDGKSPGESALYLPFVPGGAFLLGDALIGKPEGELNLLPHDKFRDVGKAVSGLEALLPYSYEMVLVGDGTSLFKNGKEAVRSFFKRMTSRDV